MNLMNLIILIVTSITLIIILLICAERKWNPIERIIGKKLKVVYYPGRFCIYKLSHIDGIFLAISNTEYSYLLSMSGDISDAAVETITPDEYDVEICYGKKTQF